MRVFARVELGMTKAEFLSLSLREFDLMRRRQEEVIKRRGAVPEFMLAQLIAMVGNTSFRGFKEPLKATDFIPTHRGQPETRQRGARKKISQKERISSIRKAMISICGVS